MYSFHFCAKSRTRDLFLKKCGRISLVKALQLSEGQFNSKPTALATLPQTCNGIFLCWQITQKSNNLDIFLKNYIIKAHATLLQWAFVMWFKKLAVGTIIYNHNHDFVSTIQIYLLWPISYYKAFVVINEGPTPKTFNCSKFTMETLKKLQIC